MDRPRRRGEGREVERLDPTEPDDWSRLTEGATVAITGFGG